MEQQRNQLPRNIHCTSVSGSHVQGITLDTKHEYMYVSFTTALVKVDLQGNIIGSVTGLIGHLGCIDFNDEDGRVYGSLELKHDGVGKGLLKNIGAELAEEDSFYITRFDVDKINRFGMDAEKDGIMQAVYLPDVVKDYSDYLPNGDHHRYCCSGIDGTAIGPVPGAGKDSPSVLLVAYGIYGRTARKDNDCQILLQYDWRKFDSVAQPLSQLCPHHSGMPCEKRYFVYTGNTTYGIQNLEYDAYTGDYFAAVYVGEKPQFPNYPMFVIDGSVPPEEKEIPGLDGEKGWMLSLKKQGLHDPASGIYGYSFPYGDTGLYSLGNGYYYISHHIHPDKLVWGTDAKLYRYEGKPEALFTLVEDAK